MIKLKDLLLERVDYHELATQLVNSYNLKSKIKFGTGKTYGEYVPEKDLITLRPSYKTIKEFLLTVLHEIRHALDAKKLGVNTDVISGAWETNLQVRGEFDWEKLIGRAVSKD